MGVTLATHNPPQRRRGRRPTRIPLKPSTSPRDTHTNTGCVFNSLIRLAHLPSFPCLPNLHRFFFSFRCFVVGDFVSLSAVILLALFTIALVALSTSIRYLFFFLYIHPLHFSININTFPLNAINILNTSFFLRHSTEGKLLDILASHKHPNIPPIMPMCRNFATDSKPRQAFTCITFSGKRIKFREDPKPGFQMPH